MKNLTIILLIVLIQISVFAQPKIKISEGTKLELGQMIAGDKTEKKITIENIGKDTLIIHEVKAGCGCTAALLSDKIIPPKKKGSLSIGFDSKGFEGKVHKSVTVTSNDTSNSPLVITFSADVTMLLKFDPQFIYFQNLTFDSTASAKITIKNNTTEAIEITSIQNKIQGLKTELMQRKLMPNEITELLATYTPTGEGMIQNEIILNTTNKKQPQIPLRFFAFVKNK